MGGRLSRKKRGYNVNDPKESKTTADSSENPEVKQDEPENEDASKEQIKTTEGELPEEKPETEASKIASEAADAEKQTDLAAADAEKQTDLAAADAEKQTDLAAADAEKQTDLAAADAEKQTDLAAADAKTEEKATVDIPALSISADSAPSSDVQESVTSTNLVEATKPVPDQSEHGLVTEAEVQFSSTLGIDLSAEVLDVVPVQSEGETQTGATPDRSANGETQKKPALDNVTEVSKDPSTEKSSLCDHAATKLVEDGQQFEEKSHVNLEDIQVESDEVLEKISVEKFKDEMSVHESIVSQEKVSLQSTLKEEIESSIQETKSESGVKCRPPKEVEIPKLAEITEETPIDVVLKNEMARCADNLEKVVVGPDTPDEGSEKVLSESLHPTVQIVADVKTKQSAEHSTENSDCMQDGSTQENSNEVSEVHSQLLEGSGNISVDTSREDSCSTARSVTDVVQAKLNDPVAAESAPEVVHAEKEVTETRYEQTVNLTGHKDSIEEISLLKTSSALIPDIKLTVYTEALQEEEKMEINTEPPVKGSTDDKTLPEDIAEPQSLNEVQSIVPDATTEPQPLNEVLAEKQSTSCSVEIVLETVSSDQEMVKLDEALEDPVPESRSSPNVGQSPTEVIKTEETNSTKTENGVSVDGEKIQNEFTSQTEEDNISETSVANGTSVDDGVKGQSKSTSKAEANGQSEATIAEENLQAGTEA